MWDACSKGQWHLRKHIQSSVPKQGEQNPLGILSGIHIWKKLPRRHQREGQWGRENASLKLQNSNQESTLRRHNSRAWAYPEAPSYATWLSMTQSVQSQPSASTPTLAHAQVHHWGMSAPETQFEFWLNREEYPACYWEWSVSGA